MTTKFPVVSENGNEYLVKIYRHDLFAGYSVDLYDNYINWRGKKKFYRIHSTEDCWTYYGDETWNHNLVEIAKDFVKDYENTIKQQEETKKLKRDELHRFEEWDGKC